MSNHPNRSQSARKIAEAAGFYVREGSYQGTTDDRLGRWYVGHKDEDGFKPFGPGYRSQKAAWEAARDQAEHDPTATVDPSAVAFIRRQAEVTGPRAEQVKQQMRDLAESYGLKADPLA
jgi:hypothetical protein